jgi:hypothetical protein
MKARYQRGLERLNLRLRQASPSAQATFASSAAELRELLAQGGGPELDPQLNLVVSRLNRLAWDNTKTWLTDLVWREEGDDSDGQLGGFDFLLLHLGEWSNGDYPVALYHGPDFFTQPLDQLQPLATGNSGFDPTAAPVAEQLAAVEAKSSYDLKVLGEALFDGLFPGPLADTYRHVFNESLDAGNSGLRLFLQLDAPELAVVPWEYTRDSQRDRFLGSDVQTPLTRFVRPETPSPEPRWQERLQVLVVAEWQEDWNNPEWIRENGPDWIQKLTPIYAGDELANICTALEPWKAMGVVEASLYENLTLNQILDQVAAETPHVVHLICHGIERNDEHHLLLTDENGSPTLIGEGRLQAAFAALPERRVSLVILQACDSGPELRSGLAVRGLAPSLAKLGIPAVIAMQYSVYLLTAQRFAAAFYAALANNNPADVAVTSARQALQARYGLHRRDFGIPLCYVAQADALRRYP